MKNSRWFAYFLSGLALFNHALGHAQDSRVKTMVYEENKVYALKSMPLVSTQVIFSPEEYVLGSEGGDTAAWMVTYNEHLHNMVFIKQTLPDSNSNIFIMTNKHSYYFHVVSSSKLANDTDAQTYAIRFTYPKEERTLLNKKLKEEALRKQAFAKPKEAKPYNWAYRFSGHAALQPRRVFDDGTFTYFELQPNQPVAAIFAVDNKEGKESLVNTRRQGNTIIVHRTAPQFTLRNGGKVASVFNSNDIIKIKQGRA